MSSILADLSLFLDVFPDTQSISEWRLGVPGRIQRGS